PLPNKNHNKATTINATTIFHQPPPEEFAVVIAAFASSDLGRDSGSLCAPNSVAGSILPAPPDILPESPAVAPAPMLETGSSGAEKTPPSNNFPNAPRPRPAGTAAANDALFSRKCWVMAL